MICDSKKMASRVAIAGALKMNKEGYTFRPWGGGGTVAKADHSRNFVTLSSEGVAAHCTCQFYAANWEYRICKHLQWAQWQVAAAAEREAQQAWEDKQADEASERMANAEHPTSGCVQDKWRALTAS